MIYKHLRGRDGLGADSQTTMLTCQIDASSHSRQNDGPDLAQIHWSVQKLASPCPNQSAKVFISKKRMKTSFRQTDKVATCKIIILVFLIRIYILMEKTNLHITVA